MPLVTNLKRLESFSYEAQLNFLARVVEAEKDLVSKGGTLETYQLQMYLSLAESVKKARDCNLNHRNLER